MTRVVERHEPPIKRNLAKEMWQCDTCSSTVVFEDQRQITSSRISSPFMVDQYRDQVTGVCPVCEELRSFSPPFIPLFPVYPEDNNDGVWLTLLIVVAVAVAVAVVVTALLK